MGLKYVLVLMVLLVLLSGCSSETIKSAAQKTIIKAKGFGGVDMVISPSEGKNVKGIVTIELKNVPEAISIAGFFIYLQGEQLQGGPNLGLDMDGSDGWSYILDTTNYDNGVYEVGAVVGESIGEDKDPLGAVTTQIIIQN